MDQSQMYKFAFEERSLKTHAQPLPYPKNNGGCLFSEFFPSLNFE